MTSSATSGVRTMPDSYPLRRGRKSIEDVVREVASGVRARLAMDDAPEAESGGMKRLLAILAKNLSAEELAEILPHLAALCGGGGETTEDETPDDVERLGLPLGRATPPNGIRGNAPGAMDARTGKSFLERFPEIAHIKVGDGSRPVFAFDQGQVSISKSFREMYAGTTLVKVG